MGKKELSTNERNQVVQFIHEGCKDGKPIRGRFVEAQQKFHLGRMTIYKLWKSAKQQMDNGDVIHVRSGKLTCERPPKIRPDLNKLSGIHFSKRDSMGKLAVSMGVSKTTVGRWVGEGLIKAHSSAIKPSLTTENRLHRLRFSLESLKLDRELNKLEFKGMHNIVHIDEKWFYMSPKNRKFYLAPGELEPYRSCKSKGFILKVMFMCAVCGPLFSDNGEVLFDGKIGIFPFVEDYKAKRNSKHRDKGTIEIKALDSITKQVIKECVIEKIIPAIMSKWPITSSKEIYIQQDNARPHIKDCDEDFRKAATENGFNIHLIQQPPNSPDCNVNDLGWFRVIQSLQYETNCTTIVELLDAVINSFDRLTPISLDNIFLSLQGCFVEIMKLKGGNSYKLPHMGKEALRRADILPLNIQVTRDLVVECINQSQRMGQD